MKLRPLLNIFVVSIAAKILTGIHAFQARPYPDHLGICYYFVGDIQERAEPCVISPGYGAGAL